MHKPIDWAAYAGFASAVLTWPPDVFWQATPAEFYAALIGYQRHVLGVDPAAAATKMDLLRLQNLFPDT